ncbi:Lrp/AsnC family transcriptional regulator [Pelomonas sp. CA6]|uniref:siroheme decarboxylase subunit beta n=1 Tax=Pelomonas sp. CA6 TaxID=2907999 RepID=UPI001F4B1468|nr:Lrp/AsnC family transcriptional regulator [Pelomonas sp. CA6]MCH7341790.1 Lrp/AsnC family transcriptional regulator [Pelomonas sp. CA6]
MDDALDQRLLNDWQHRFPLRPRPFDALARACGVDEAQVLQRLSRLREQGFFSRIGAVWNAGAGGAALLCAMAVPAERLDTVAALVGRHPGVNHSYEREHLLNLWFVLTGARADALQRDLDALEAASGLTVLRLPMRRAYRIDLGFDLAGGATASALRPPPPAAASAPLAPQHHALAALAEEGLALEPRPYARWARQLGMDEPALHARLQDWLDGGQLRRFGIVVRHHELGYAANAMCVFDAPDDAVDALGARLAAQPGVTLCYRRERAPGWRYNLFCMLHGRERGAVLALLARARAAAGLEALPQDVLFSLRRFKQCGARYFAEPSAEPAWLAPEHDHA